MPADKIELLQIGSMHLIEEQLDALFTVHRIAHTNAHDAILEEAAPRIRAIATAGTSPLNGALMQRLPGLEIVSNFGVGYDTVDAKWAASTASSSPTRPTC
jgi:lactate dehydrogenase-like 2-hydroxyacid dehydrogenase